MGISIWQLLILLAIVLVLFGTKKLRNLGGDLGGAISGFKKAMKEEEKTASVNDKPALKDSPTNEPTLSEHKTTDKIDAPHS